MQYMDGNTKLSRKLAPWSLRDFLFSEFGSSDLVYQRFRGSRPGGGPLQAEMFAMHPLCNPFCRGPADSVNLWHSLRRVAKFVIPSGCIFRVGI